MFRNNNLFLWYSIAYNSWVSRGEVKVEAGKVEVEVGGVEAGKAEVKVEAGKVKVEVEVALKVW